MPTFIIKNNPQLKDPIALTLKDLHHLKKVLRAKAGEIFFVTDNEGTIGKVKVLNTNPFEFNLIEKQKGAKPFSITVYLPLIDQDRLEWAVEKLTELNIESVQLTLTEHTQNKNFSEKKFERLQKISETAQKQCGRAYPLKILSEKKLEELKFKKDDLNFVATLKATKRHPGQRAGIQTSVVNNWIPHHVRDDQNENLHTNLFIGPEGGFSENEEKFFTEKGCRKIKLGPTVLRTETAALVLTTQILSQKNQINQ